MTLKLNQLISGEKAIMAYVRETAKASADAADRIHIALCSALAHVKEHGNATVVDHVVDFVIQNTHQSVNMRGIGVFLRKYTNMRPGENDKGQDVWRKPKNKPLSIDLDGAMANPFWTLPASLAANTTQLFDVETRFLSFLGQVRKHIGAGDVKNKEFADKAMKVLEDGAKALALDLSKVPTVADGKAEAKNVAPKPGIVAGERKPTRSARKPANANEPAKVEAA